MALELADMPGGALVGTVVHGALERTEFDAPDLAAEVAEAVDREVAWRNVDLGNPDAVVSGLCTAIGSPLGPMVGDISLRDIARRDRLDELGFEIPLVGGDLPKGSLHVADVADLLEEHLPGDDPVARYAARLRDPALSGVLRGYLTGSLDLVFRLPDGRFVVADYKTNKLGPPDETLTAWHYRPAALDAEMAAAHYPLQAAAVLGGAAPVPAVAVPRLRRRSSIWAVSSTSSSAAWSGPRRPHADGQPCGVWSWHPPAHLIESLSELFDNGAPT